mgnify:CR=1 FL=1
MSVGDITPFENAVGSKMAGSMKFYVATGATGADNTVSRIRAGEPVTRYGTGAGGVIAALTGTPTASSRIVGVAASTSTETASVSGTVDVIPTAPGQVWLISPLTAATWDTQAEYNALVGKRMVLDNTAGVYTIAATDAAGNGMIVEYLDVARYPGKVAFSWSSLVSYLNN